MKGIEVPKALWEEERGQREKKVGLPLSYSVSRLIDRLHAKFT